MAIAYQPGQYLVGRADGTETVLNIRPDNQSQMTLLRATISRDMRNNVPNRVEYIIYLGRP